MVINGNLFHYQNGVKTQLSNFTSELWDVKDDIVIWSENSFIYSFSNKVKVPQIIFKYFK